MSAQITSLYPQGLWKNFYDLTRIPRPSKHEQQVIAHVRDFGRQLGLETEEDTLGNIVIRKPATKGLENCPGVILQAHLDMVPQKNNDKVHDFTKDPIETIVDGDWVRANQTTLGSDNGIGAAAIMAVLEAQDLTHPPLEGLFTIDEETGMTGAFGLKPGFLKGSVLLNTDSEDEGELCIGCAGGIDANISFPFQAVKTTKGLTAVKITVKGLRGGHSGTDINLGRANSNLILARLLWRAVFKFHAHLADFNGGDMRNAIPREASATIVMQPGELAGFSEFIDGHTNILKTEFAAAEPDLMVSWEKAPLPLSYIDEEVRNRFISALYTSPNGVIRMSNEMEELVETSMNIAIVKTTPDALEVKCLLRSSIETAKEDLASRLRALFTLADAEISFAGSYPGWKPNPASKTLATMRQVYSRMFGKEAIVGAVHAGLECGIIGSIYPHLDMVSFGPTIKHPHSPDEKVHIGSVGLFWDYLCAVLKSLC